MLSSLEIQSQAAIGGPEISPDASSIAVRAVLPGQAYSQRGVWLIPAPLGGPPRKLLEPASSTSTGSD